ncbi:MAG TPA: hypothetical protein VE820_00890 [Sphingomicrobium sp.]|nr:hypothetical protein [Sphingomicrobium sp.]
MSLLLVTALLSADPSVQAPPAAPVAQAVMPKPKKDKKICKTDDDTTGSHMVKRTCLTQEEWDSRVQGRTVDEMKSAPVSH